MEFIIIIAVIYFIIKVLSSNGSSTSSNSNSTISEVDTGGYITLEEYDKIDSNTLAAYDFVSEQLIGTIKKFDNSNKIGTIVNNNYTYEIIFQRNFNYNSFPNHMPKVNDKVIFQSQAINGKLYASNIEYCRPNMINNNSNINSSVVSITSSNTTLIEQEQSKQIQNINTTPPVQEQRTQTQNANNNILDEHILIETVRAMPLWLNTESVNISENSSINNLCAGLANKAVSDIMAGETLMQFENIIHQKRLRTPNKTEYDRKMENNIFYELFCYSYLVNVIEAVPKKLNGSLNVDFVKYISLAENECRKRVQNLEQEKKNTRSIEVILNQYTRSTAQYKMPILGFINQRENDFIIAQLMHNCIIPCIAPLFYDSKEQWQTFNTVSAKEFAQTLDVYLSQGISMRLSMYAGDTIFNI